MKDKKLTLELKTLSNLITRKIDRQLDHLGVVTGTRAYIIGYLWENRNKVHFQKDIEKTFSIQRATATGILQRMEQDGLIRRIGSKEDARMKKIELTKKAIQEHKKMEKEILQINKQLEMGIPEQDLYIFYKILDQIKINLS